MSIFKNIFSSFNKNGTKSKEKKIVPHWQRNSDDKPTTNGIITADNKLHNDGLNPVSNVKIETGAVILNMKPDSGHSKISVNDATSSDIPTLGMNSTTNNPSDIGQSNGVDFAQEVFQTMDSSDGSKKVVTPDKTESVALDKSMNLVKAAAVDEKNNNVFDGLGSWMDDRCAAPIIPEKIEPKVNGSDVPLHDGRRRYSTEQLLELKRVQDEEFKILGISGGDDDFLCAIGVKLRAPEDPGAGCLKPGFDYIKNNKKKNKKVVEIKISEDVEQKKATSVDERCRLLNRLNVIDKNLLNCSACMVLVMENYASEHIDTPNHKQQLCLENLKKQRELIAEYPKVFEEWQLNDLYYSSNRIFLDPVIDKYVYCGICCVELHLNLKELEEHVSSRKHDRLFMTALEEGRTSVDGIVGDNNAVKQITDTVAAVKSADKVVKTEKVEKVAAAKNTVAVDSAKDENDVDFLVKFLRGMSCSVPAADTTAVEVDEVVEKPVLAISGTLALTRYANDNWGCRLSNGTIACLVCNVQGLEGNRVVGHFDSPDHKRIVERMQKSAVEKFMPKILHENCVSATYDIHPVVYQCLICEGAKGSFSTQDTMAHIVGEAHKASKEKWRRVPNTCPLLYAKIQPHKLSTVKLWCAPCQKELFNIAHAFHHIDQAPHHPNTSVDFITSIGNSVYNCTVCLLTLHGENDLILHYRSPKHRDNKQEANTIKSATKKSINKEFQQKNEQQKNNVTTKVPLLSLPYPPVNAFPAYRFPGPSQPYNGPQPQVPYLLQQPNFIPHPRGPNPYNASQPYNAPHPNQFLVLNHPVDNYNYAAGTVTGDTRAPGYNHSARNDFNHGGNNRHNADHAHNNGNRRPHPNRRGNHQNNNQRRNLDNFTQRINMSERRIDEDNFKEKDTGRNQKGTDVKKPQIAAKKTPVEAAKPVVQATKPAVQATKPAAQANKPAVQAKKPTSDVTIPRLLNQDANNVAAKAAADKKAHKAAMAAKAAAINKKKMKAIEQQKRDTQNELCVVC